MPVKSKGENYESNRIYEIVQLYMENRRFLSWSLSLLIVSCKFFNQNT